MSIRIPRSVIRRVPGVGLCLSALVGLLVCTPVRGQDDHDEHLRAVKRPVIVVRDSQEPVYAWSMQGSRAFLGVQSIELTPELRRHFGVPESAGVMISKVTPESPAARSGIAVGDILTAIDSESIDSTTDLLMAIGKRESDAGVQVEIWRDGRVQILSATLTEHEGPWVDIRQFHLGEGHAAPHHASPEELEDAIEIETELFNTAIERLHETIDSPEWHERIYRFKAHQGDLMERIEILEKRLRELEEELEALPSDD
jgi:membrane-associated protease RseP (regulator of RpoE activity)